jgi:hypothetical protein
VKRRVIRNMRLGLFEVNSEYLRWSIHEGRVLIYTCDGSISIVLDAKCYEDPRVWLRLGVQFTSVQVPCLCTVNISWSQTSYHSSAPGRPLMSWKD